MLKTCTREVVLSVYRGIVPFRNIILSAEEVIWTVGKFTTSGVRVIWEHWHHRDPGVKQASSTTASRWPIFALFRSLPEAAERKLNWTGFQNQSNKCAAILRHHGMQEGIVWLLPRLCLKRAEMLTSPTSTPFHNPMQAHWFLQTCYVLVFILKMVPCVKNVQ